MTLILVESLYQRLYYHSFNPYLLVLDISLLCLTPAHHVIFVWIVLHLNVYCLIHTTGWKQPMLPPIHPLVLEQFLFFSGVRLYPGLVCNLWSPGKMMEDGWQLSFAANGDIRANHSNANFQTLVFTFNQTTKLWYGYLPLSEISSVEMVNSHTPTSM